MELIDKAALVAEINKRIMDAPIDCYGHQRVWAYNDVKDVLNTLETKEVDLDFHRFAEEMKTVFALPSSKTKNTEEEPLNWEYAIAKHFFELGLKSKSSYVGIPNIDDTLKEMGVDPDSKSAKSFKEFYYMALERFKAQKGE